MTIQKGLIGRQDFNLWNGNSEKTFSRKTSTGGIVTLSKVNHFVDVYALYGACTDREITKALSWVGSNNCVFLLSPAIWDIANDLSIPSNVVFEIPLGATLSVSSGKTLTMVNPPIAGPYQVFTGSGTVTITGYPQDSSWSGGIQRNAFSWVSTSTFTATDALITNINLTTLLSGGEIKNSLISFYDFNDQVIHQISSNEILSLNETFSFA